MRVGDVAHHREVVRNEKIRQPEFLLQILHQVDDLRLHGYVQRRDGFIAHHEFRLQRQRAGDADALALAAGKFVRVAVRRLARQGDQVQHVGHPARPFGAVAEAVDGVCLGDDGADRLARIERTERVLEDDLQVSPSPAQRFATELRELGALVHDGSVRRFQQSQKQATERGFAAAGFADQAERFALVTPRSTPSTARTTAPEPIPPRAGKCLYTPRASISSSVIRLLPARSRTAGCSRHGDQRPRDAAPAAWPRTGRADTGSAGRSGSPAASSAAPEWCRRLPSAGAAAPRHREPRRSRASV